MAPERGHHPEWVSATVTDATQITETGHAHPVRVKVGMVRMHGDTGLRIAAQADDRDLFVFPPASAALFVGALSRGLRHG